MALRTKGAGKRPDLDYVLLCLINMHDDVSGYQLRSFISDSTGHLYRAHLSQIYPALKRLHEAQLVTQREVAREGKPDLKLYSITEAGREVAREWLLQPYEFKDTRDNTSKFFLRLVLMGHLEPEKTLRHIDAGIEELTRQRDEHAATDLQLDLEYLSDADEEVRKRYEVIWSHELSMVLAEYDLRIKCLQDLRNKLA